jgi:soluble lytic murein transglycosylase-like protein
MQSVHRAVFAAVLFAGYLIFLISSSLSAPAVVQASTALAAAPDPNMVIDHSVGCSLSNLYPVSVRQWCSLIEKHAAENHLDGGLLAAVILQESGGHQGAYSSSGAVGLMQIMPRDGLAAGFMCVNGPCFTDRPSITELYDPEFNISYGARLLSNLINNYGSLREGLKAYGPAGMGYDYADIILSINSSKF